MSLSPDIHVTTLVIIVCAALCAERILVAYATWKVAKRKGRMWLPYALFGLLGLVVVVLRSPAYSTLALHLHPARRPGYTHTGFGGPAPDNVFELPVRQSKRTVPLAGYHLPATDRVR